MNVIDQLRKHLNKTNSRSSSGSSHQFGNVEMAIPQVPVIEEKRGQDWVGYGERNLHPMMLSDLKYGSAIHNAIISTAGDMIAGDGFLINGAKTPEDSLAKYGSLASDQKTKYDAFILNENNDLTIPEIKAKLAFDFKEQGACAYEIVFNTDFSRVATVKYVDVKNIRAGKMVNDKVISYWYSRDWSNIRQNKPKEMQAADFKRAANKDDKNKSLNQLVYIKRGSLEYYGEPDYAGALTWIQIDFQMGIFHLANIENGMNPSMAIKFYKLPATEQDKQNILDEIQRRYVGAKRTGKHMVFFSDGKDMAPDVDAITTSNLDKQLLNLAELADRKILTGHKLTSPLLAGISTSGQIGGNIEIEKGFKIYDKTRIAPFSNQIDGSFNKILRYNKTEVIVARNPLNPFA